MSSASVASEDRAASRFDDLSLKLWRDSSTEITENFSMIHELCLFIIKRRRDEIDSCEEGFPFSADVWIVLERKYCHTCSLGVIFFLSFSTRICSFQEVIISRTDCRNNPYVSIDFDIKSILIWIIWILTMSDS